MSRRAVIFASIFGAWALSATAQTKPSAGVYPIGQLQIIRALEARRAGRSQSQLVGKKARFGTNNQKNETNLPIVVSES